MKKDIFTRSYLLAMVIIALVVTTAFFVTQVNIASNSNVAEIINKNGKQRMLIQHIMIETMHLDYADKDHRVLIHESIDDIILEFNLIQVYLDELGRSDELEKIYKKYEIEKNIKEFFQMLDDLHDIFLQNISLARKDYMTQMAHLHNYADVLTNGLNATVAQRQLEAEYRSTHISYIETFFGS